MKVTRDLAAEWATWFRCLSDPSRVLILHLLATRPRALSVGEIVEALDIGQSTVSHHVRMLAESCFVFVERRGTASYVSINEACLQEFPSAAAVVMGQAGRGTARRSPAARPGRSTPRRRRAPQTGGR